MAGWWGGVKATADNFYRGATGLGASHNRSQLQRDMGRNKDPYYGVQGEALTQTNNKQGRQWMRQQLSQVKPTTASKQLLGGG